MVVMSGLSKPLTVKFHMLTLGVCGAFDIPCVYLHCPEAETGVSLLVMLSAVCQISFCCDCPK